jgi:hypothetical protein
MLIMVQPRLIVLYLCNAVDEETKKERNIRFDSPAATNKVLGLAKALQTQTVDIQVLSLGRGKQTGSYKKFPAKSTSVNGIPVHYAAFWHMPLLTHIVGSLSMALKFNKFLKDHSGRVIVIAYNRLWHYLPTLILAKLKHASGYLDLEDGTIISSGLKTFFRKSYSVFYAIVGHF